MNVMDYNFKYKLRSVFEREDDFIAIKWTWFDIQVCNILLWTWVASRALVNYTEVGRIICSLFGNLQALFMSVTNCKETITSYFRTSLVVTQGPMIIYGYPI